MNAAMMSLAASLLLACTVLAPTANAANDSCFGSLGCFSNNAPWTTLLRPLPSPMSPDDIGIQFSLHTRTAPNRFVVANPSDGVYSVAGSTFDGSKPTIFVIHGFRQFGNDSMLLHMKDALLTKTDANVFIIGWNNLQGTRSLNFYFQMAANTRVVAAKLAQFLKTYLMASQGVAVDRVHLIGYSLGAQISGYTGKAIPNIGRITALDPAQPGFEGYENAVRLVASDAVYVDAYHTDGKPFMPTLGYGCVFNTGHVDFYFNGGWNQPGCLESVSINVTSFVSLATTSSDAIFLFIRCPHDRVHQLFIATMTVRNCTFWGHKSNSYQRALSSATGGTSAQWWGTPCSKATCLPVGLDSIHYPARGQFEVTTSKTPPYCLSDPKADVTMAPFYV